MTKTIVTLAILVSGFAANAETAKAATKPSHGTFTCDMVYDSTVTLEQKLNSTCETSKPATLSSIIRPNGSIGTIFCCIAK